MFEQVNYIAVVVAAAAAFAFGAVWYMSLAKVWLAALGRGEPDKMSPGPFIVSGIGLLVMAFVLWGVMFHAGPMSIGNGLMTGALAWLGFVVTTQSVNYAYQKQKPVLSVIDAGHWLGVLLIMGAVLGAFGA